jgi:hypothetical protein
MAMAAITEQQQDRVMKNTANAIVPFSIEGSASLEMYIGPCCIGIDGYIPAGLAVTITAAKAVFCETPFASWGPGGVWEFGETINCQYGYW